MTVNVGFADGHVARIKAEDLLVKKASDGHYENQVSAMDAGFQITAG